MAFQRKIVELMQILRFLGGGFGCVSVGVLVSVVWFGVSGMWCFGVGVFSSGE